MFMDARITILSNAGGTFGPPSPRTRTSSFSRPDPSSPAIVTIARAGVPAPSHRRCSKSAASRPGRPTVATWSPATIGQSGKRPAMARACSIFSTSTATFSGPPRPPSRAATAGYSASSRR